MHTTMLLMVLDSERGYREILAEREQQIALAMPVRRLHHRDLLRVMISRLSRVRSTLAGTHTPGSDGLTQPVQTVAFAGR